MKSHPLLPPHPQPQLLPPPHPQPPPILILSRCGQRIFSISSASGISSLFSLYALVVNFIYCIAIYNQTISHVYHSPVILIYAAAYIVNKKSKDIML